MYLFVVIVGLGKMENKIMNEATIVAKVKTEAQRQLPGAVILKLQDYMTVGIPDLVINFNKHVLWVEVKLLKDKETPSGFKKHFDKLQLATCRLLDNQTLARYFIAYTMKENLCGAVIQPAQLAYFLNEDKPNFANIGVLADFNGPFNDAVDHLIFLARGRDEKTNSLYNF